MQLARHWHGWAPWSLTFRLWNGPVKKSCDGCMKHHRRHRIKFVVLFLVFSPKSRPFIMLLACIVILRCCARSMEFNLTNLLTPTQEQLVDFFPSPTCSKVFSTIQGLTAHRWKQHGHISDERRFVFNGVCESCRKCFWTAQRLQHRQQHLRYSKRKPTLLVGFATFGSLGWARTSWNACNSSRAASTSLCWSVRTSTSNYHRSMESAA